MSESESDSDSLSSYAYDDDLVETLRSELTKGTYTCLICTNDVGIDSKIWSCGVCWRVYDLDCVVKWSKRRAPATPNGPAVVPDVWKCPSCNSPQSGKPKYTCWCGKVSNPAYDGLTPHSCGQTCSSKDGNTACRVHGCGSICHPGPHSECSAIGPPLLCDCGKSKRQWPCIITPYDGWTCRTKCGEMMPCGEHVCTRDCHSGLCGTCQEPVEALCYCGRTRQSVPCSARIPAYSESETSRWVGFFACEKPCEDVYECGVHKCKQIGCHSKTKTLGPCPLSPKPNETCPCGQTLVQEILSRERSSCSEPIPTCGKVCKKPLACGHACLSLCHPKDTPCSPCRQFVTSKCACSSHLYDVPCQFKLAGDVPRCSKRCTALMSCRRHRCTEICCAYEQQALTRERTRKRHVRNHTSTAQTLDNDLIEAVHQCQEVCNKPLSCGKHNCVMTCHTGPCLPCLESSDQDWHCSCGKTIVAAPIRCGYTPECLYNCHREPACGHPKVQHLCHDDSTTCPPCPYPTTKICLCGQNEVRGVQCFRNEVSCGVICDAKLLCGHSCGKACHKPGDHRLVTDCRHLCGKTLPCGHKHKQRCHQGSKCEALCQDSVDLKCKCGHLSMTLLCHRVLSSNVELIGMEENQPVPDTAPVSSYRLRCDESCAIRERNARLAAALLIDDRDRADLNHEYDSKLLDLYHADPVWGDDMFETVSGYVRGALADNEAGKTVGVLRFPPMRRLKRMFLHILAQEFGLVSMAQDPEPGRFVTILKGNQGRVPNAPLSKYYQPKVKKTEPVSNDSQTKNEETDMALREESGDPSARKSGDNSGDEAEEGSFSHEKSEKDMEENLVEGIYEANLSDRPQDDPQEIFPDET